MGVKKVLDSTQEFDFPRGGGLEVSADKINELETAVDDKFTDKNRKKKARRSQKDPRVEQIHAGIKEVVIAETLAKHVSRRLLKTGDKVWGMVVDIGKMHLRIALPNGLEGRVHASNACDFLAAAFSSDSINPQARRSEHYPQELPSLSSLFFVGQFVRCTVIEDCEPVQGGLNPTVRPSVVLTLVLAILHEHLKPESLHEGMLIAGCVMNDEDHGYSVALGVDSDGSKMTGFLPHPRDTNTPKLSMLPGMIVEFSVKKVVDQGSVILSCIPEKIAKISRNPGFVCDFGEVLPGMLVNATIQQIVSTGLSVSFLDHEGHIGLAHLQEDMTSTDWQKNYEIDQGLPARIIQVNPDTHDVSLSLKAHLIDFTMPFMPPIVGQTFEKARIVRVEPDSGVLVEIPSDSMKTPGFVDKGMMDDELAKKLASPGLQGSNIKVRVTGFRPMDGVLAACSKKDVLISGFLNYEDLLPGMVLKGTVAGLEDGRINLVKLAEGIRGLVPFRLRNVRKDKGAVKIGAQVACRVIDLEPAERRVFVTTNERLVNTDVPIISDWSDVEVGMRSAGWISGKYYPNGLKVQFCGGLMGFVSYKHLGVSSEVEAAKQYPPGHYLTVYITWVDMKSQKIELSLQKGGIRKSTVQKVLTNQRPGIELAPCTGGKLWPGDVVNGCFEKCYKEKDGTSSILISISSKARGIQGEAVLEAVHLSDSQIGANRLLECLSAGSALGRLMVLQVEPCLMVTRKQSLVERAELLPSIFEDLKESMFVHGYVSHVSDHLVRVKFLKDLEGIVRYHQLPLGGISPRAQCYKGQSVCAQVLRLSASNRSFDLTMNRDRTGSKDTKFLQHYFKDIQFAHKLIAKQHPDLKKWNEWPKELAFGWTTTVILSQKDNSGWQGFCKGHPDIEVHIANNHCGKIGLVSGKEVKAVILDINPARSLLVSLKSELLGKRSKSALRTAASVGTRLSGIVQLVLDVYAVVSLPSWGHELVFVPAIDYNLQGNSVFAVGQKVEGALSVLPCKATGGRTLMYVPLAFQSVRDKRETNEKGSSSQHQEKEQMEAPDMQMSQSTLENNKAPEKNVQTQSSTDCKIDSEKLGKKSNKKGTKKAGEACHEHDMVHGRGSCLISIPQDDIESEEMEEIEESDSDVECAEGFVSSVDCLPAQGPRTSDKGMSKAQYTNGWDELVLEDSMVVDSSIEKTSGKKRKQVPDDDPEQCNKKRVWEEREDKVRQIELNQTLKDGAPKTDTDFEKLVMEEPNSSYVWIQYMSFLLSLGEVGKARAIAERALESINFREEQEKFNIWVAYMNIENQYGKPPEEAVSKVFQRALPYTNPKKLHMAFLEILEESGHLEMASEALKTMCRKFSESSKVWVRAIEFDAKADQPGKAKKTLARALKVLPSRKHVKVIVKVGLTEFKIGNIERGREIFEGLITNYPKRLDLWNLYIDQEIRAGDGDRTKALFERATHLTLPAKKIKCLFKRYLQFAKDKGDSAGVEHVKKRAVEYVNRMTPN